MKVGTVTDELNEYFKRDWELDTKKAETITLKQARLWIEAVFSKKHGSDLDFKKALTDGILLCRIINKVIPNTIPFVNVGRNPITWLENVQFFLDGCRRVGLKEDMLFEPYDIKYFGNDDLELERRNNKIAVTLFWLSRIAKDLPIFSVIEHNQTIVEKVEIDGAEKKMESLETAHVMTNGNGETVYSRKCTNHNKEPDKERRKSVVFEDDLCDICKRNRSRAESEDKPGRPGSEEDGKFTLLVEKSEKSNEFGVTIKETDTNYPIITAVQKDSYAHKSGLSIGDYVITINGINTGNMSLLEINDKIKSVFTEGHVYLGICRLPPNETLTQKHKDSTLFQQRVKNRSIPDKPPIVEKAVPVVATQTISEVQTVSEPENDVPLVRSKTISNVQSTPIAPGPDLSEWREMLEKHKRETYKTELDHATIRDLWNKYIKTSEIDEVLSEVDKFDINKANKFKESVVQTDGNDSLNRNLTLVGHKLRRSADTFNNHVLCGCCVQAIGTEASIHLEETNFTYHQKCFSCKHCEVMLIENTKLLYNVFVVDGLPYCDVCIKKMGMIRLGKVKKMPLKTSV
ncbi:uncharacterized protein LOC134817759 isoform X2 [Bolinopsis microptera]|uniref:uncharacterized protein LOC134817759 isoform X2 n=1 Tax=Bolinopsis microptera TaxID=2820187 RepID=UPI003079087B